MERTASKKRGTTRTQATAVSKSGPDSKWTFLTNHSHVLVLLATDPNSVLREVAAEVGITERAVQRIVRELEAAGILQRERIGRRNHYNVCTDVNLRHPIESHRTVGDLLELLSSGDES